MLCVTGVEATGEARVQLRDCMVRHTGLMEFPAVWASDATRVSLDGVTANIDDSFFKRARRFSKNELKSASEHRLKAVESGKAQEQKWREELKGVQKSVDAKLLENIKKVQQLRGYLGTRFTLSNSTRPHELRF